MEKYKMTGVVEQVGSVQLIGQNKFRKREVVLCDDPGAEYPHRLVWELTQDKVSLVNESHIGAKATVTGWPESRSWKGKDGSTRWFTSMRASDVTVAAAAKPPKAATVSAKDDEVEDMPF